MSARTVVGVDRVLQFGTGRFLRGFVDAFLQDENDRSSRSPDARRRMVTVVESSGSGAADRLRAHGFRYQFLVRGLLRGRIVDESSIIDIIDGSIDTDDQRGALLDVALDPALTIVVSNTTEAGYHPERFPARLSMVLEARARAGLPGLTILPCELIEDNGRTLRDLVLADARRRRLDPSLTDRLIGSNVWAVTVVDRIATAPAPGDPVAEDDPFAVVAEPYASWVIEVPGDVPLPSHPSVERVEDVRPFALRKMRILNGAHTALVARTRTMGIELVREAMDEPDVASWLEELLLDEVVPALGERIVDGAGFARVAMERFRNPFQEHRLRDIAIGHEGKLALRLLPTYREYAARFGHPPPVLGALLAREGVV